MGGVKIVTDSTADIPEELAQTLDISVVPAYVHFGRETFLDGVELSRREFFARLRTSKVLPSTSAPSPAAYATVYKRLAEAGYKIVSIHLASKLSTIYQVAHLGAQMVAEADVTLVDSGQVSMGYGWLAVAAARAAQAGATLSEVRALVQELLPRTRLIAMLDDLRFIHHGGRVSWIAAMLGTLLHVKPLVAVAESELHLLERVRTRARALQRLTQMVAEMGTITELIVLHADAPEMAEELRSLISERVVLAHPPLLAEAGIIISTHAGPGAIGVACLLDKYKLSSEES